MTIGDTVYWLGAGNSVICSGKVVATAGEAWKDGIPRHIVIEFGGGFVLKDTGNGWEQVFRSKVDAYREGCSRLAKTITEANRSMMTLVESQNEPDDAPKL